MRWSTNSVKKLIAGLVVFVSVSFTQGGTLGVLTYSISGGEVTVTDCDTAATGVVNIPETIEGLPVTTIGNSAFQSCSLLSGITLPEGITSVGDSAFRFCSLMTSINVPVSVSNMGERVFEHCRSLTDIAIPSGVSNIQNYSFWSCASLTNLTIPSSVTTIGIGAFAYCDSLTQITIPAGATSIGWQAFEECSQLISIDVEAGNLNFVSVDGILFNASQSKLIKYPALKPEAAYTLPSSVTYIDIGAFSYNTFLTNVTLSPNLAHIDYSVFKNCSSLADIVIPTTVTTIQERVFEGCTNLTSITVDAGNVNYLSMDGVLFNAALTTIMRYPPLKPGMSYTVPSTVNRINEYAFEYCSVLESIVLPEGLDSIGTSAFGHCGSLMNLTIPETTSFIGYYAFEGCSSLSSFVWPSGVTRIISSTFRDCTSLTNISLSTNLTEIGNFTFYGCSSLQEISIPASVSSIGAYVFYECDALEGINVETGNLDYISSNGVLFDIGQTELIAYPAGSTHTTCTIPASVDTIAVNAFRNSNQLLSIIVQPGNTSFSSSNGVLFSLDQTTLINYPEGRTGGYTVPAGVTKIAAHGFYGCSLLTDVTLPDGLTEIDWWGFEWCPLLTEIVLPDSITKLSDGVFYRCSGLSDITIPAGLDMIGNKIFWDCSGLSIVRFQGNAPTTFGSDVFLDTHPDLTIHYLSTNSGFTTPEWEGVPTTAWFMDYGVETDADLSADPNGDGVDLLMAYALNLDPDQDLSGSLPAPEISSNTMSMTYYAVSPGVTYTVETGTDLTAWTTNGVAISGIDTNNHQTASVDLNDPERFLRLDVSK